MSDQSIEIIVAELRDLRTRMDERFDSQDTKITEQGEKLAELSIQMKDLIGNGKPGRVKTLEDDVAKLKHYKTMLWTALSMIGAVVSAFIYRGKELMQWVARVNK